MIGLPTLLDNGCFLKKEDVEKYNLSFGGLYFLYNLKKELIYIGKSKNLSKRISQHSKGSHKDGVSNDFRYFRYIEIISEVDRQIYEIWFINKHHPKYNSQFVYKKEYIYNCGEWFNIPLSGFSEKYEEIISKQHELVLSLKNSFYSSVEALKKAHNNEINRVTEVMWGHVNAINNYHVNTDKKYKI